MWNRISQVAGFGGSEEEETGTVENVTPVSATKLQEEVEQQKQTIEQLKSLVRENEDKFKEKEKELEELTTKSQRNQLQSKAKIMNLTNQLKDKASKKDERDYDDSSSDSSDQSSRGKVILLRKQLESSKKLIVTKEKEIQDVIRNYEERIKNFEIQLQEKLSTSKAEVSSDEASDTKVQEMYAQIVYKDSKILELNNQILEQEKKMLDLQEHIKEKDEVLQTRNLAVQLMSADMNRKGKTVVDELEETRGQMKIMQSNFAEVEEKWKLDTNHLNSEIKALGEKMLQKENAFRDLEASYKKIESSRVDLATRNAELQKKIVLEEEKVNKQCENYRKAIEVDLQSLKESLKSEQMKSAELQKSLDESASQSEAKVFKARVKERTKAKAIERELVALKQSQLVDKKPDEVIHLQEKVAVLEEEKGSLQLKLMEVDEQLASQEDLKADNSRLQTFFIENQEKTELLQKEVKELHEEKCQLKAEHEELEQSLKKAQAHNQDLVSQNSSDKAEIRALKQQTSDLESKLATLEADNGTITQEFAEISDELLHLKDEKVSLEMKAIELEEIQECTIKEKNELQNIINTLQATSTDGVLLRLEEEKSAMVRKCDELTKTIECLGKTENELQEKLRDQNIQMLNQQNDLSKLSDTNSSLLIQNNTLLDDMNIMEFKVLELEKTNLDVNENVGLLKQNIIELGKEKDIVLKSMSAASVEDFQEIWASFKHSMTNMQNKLSVMEEGNKTLSTEVSKQQSEIEQCHQTIRKIEEERDQNFKLETHQLRGELNSELAINDTLSKSLTIEMEEKQRLVNLLREKSEENEKLAGSEAADVKEILRLNKLVEEKNSLLETLQENIETYLLQIAELQKEKDVALKKVESLELQMQSESSSIQTKMSSLLEQISDLEQEMVKLKEDLMIKEQVLQKTEKELINLQVQFENSIKIEAVYQNACQEKDQGIKTLQEQLVTMKQEWVKKENEFKKEHLDFVSQYEVKLEEITSELQVTVQNLNNLRTENEKLKSENNILQINFEKLEEECRTFCTEVKTKSEQLAMIKSESKSIKEQLNYAKQETSVLQHQIAIHDSSAEEKNNLYTSMAQAKSALEAEVEILKNRNQEMASELKNLTAEFQGVQGMHDQIKLHNSSLIAEVESAQINFDQLKCNLETATSQLYEKENALIEIKLQMQNLIMQHSDQISHLESELRTLNTSLGEVHNALNDNQKLLGEVKDERDTLSNTLISEQKINDDMNKKIKEYNNTNEKLVLQIEENTSVINSLEKYTEEFKNELKLQIETFDRKLSEAQNKLDISNDNLEFLATRFGLLMKNLTLIEPDVPPDFDETVFDVNNKESILKCFQSAEFRISNIENKLVEFQIERKQLKLEIANLEQRNASLNESYSSLNDQMSESKGKRYHDSNMYELNMKGISSAMSAVMTFSDEKYRVIETKFESLLHHFENTVSQTSAISRSIKKLNYGQSVLEKDNERLSVENQLLKQSVTDAEIEKNELEQQNEKLNVKVNLLQWSSSETSTDLEDKIKLLTVQISSLKDSIQEKEKQLNTFRDRDDSLQKEVELIRQENMKLGAEARENIVSLKNSIADLTRRLEKSTQNLKEKEQALIFSESKIRELMENIQETKCDLKNLIDKNASHEKSALDMTLQIEKLGEEKLYMTSAIQERETLKITIHELNEKLALKEKGLENLALEKNKLEHILDQLNTGLQLPEVSITQVEVDIVGSGDNKLKQEALQTSEQEGNESLLKRLESYKMKFDKMFSRLKVLKTKNEALTNEISCLKKIHEESEALSINNKKLNSQIVMLNETVRNLNDEFCLCREQKEQQALTLKNELNESNEKNYLLSSECETLKTELQDCRESLNNSERSCELFQINCTEVQNKLTERNAALSDLKAANQDLQNTNMQLINEKGFMLKEIQNLREHMDMVMSDNSIYQDVIEQANKAKSSLEKELVKEKEKMSKQVQHIDETYKNEMEKYHILQQKYDSQNQVLLALQKDHEVCRFSNEELQQQLEESLQHNSMLKSRMVVLAGENQKIEAQTDEGTVQLISDVLVQSPNQDPITKYIERISSLQAENQALKQAMGEHGGIVTFWKHEMSKVDTHYKNVISELEKEISTLRHNQENISNERNAKLENELHQAISSLHKQGLRCEELSLEVRKLLEERNNLRQKLVHCSDQLQLLQSQYNIKHVAQESESTKLEENSVSIQMDIPLESGPKRSLISNQSIQTEYAMLHQRLLETEVTCQELRQANEALDDALRLEKEQRKFVEEELGYAHKQIASGEKEAKDEYHLLLNDFEEPEILVETNFSISRKVKTHTHKLRRWLRGKRINLHRTCQRKKYSELLYLFYICAIHIWLLSCIFRHS